MLDVYLIDDERLALMRLEKLLRATNRVQIAGATTDTDVALSFLLENHVDALFLDIEMPGTNGFEFLSRLTEQPPIVFTTAHEQYSLAAFGVNSFDYLLKPIDVSQLNRALTKLERRTPSQSAGLIRSLAQEWIRVSRGRIAAKQEDRTVFLEVAAISHFYARNKTTYAATGSQDYVVEFGIGELEQRLSAGDFYRIHRATLLNLDHVRDVSSWFGGGLLVRLKDAKGTELQVARDRVRELRIRLGF